MSKEKKVTEEKVTKKDKKEKEVKKVEKKKLTKEEKKQLKVTKKAEKKKAKEEKKAAKKAKKSLFAKILGYFNGVKKEISRIRWTKGKELLKYSVAAVSFVLIFCVYFYVIDVLIALLRSSL